MAPKQLDGAAEALLKRAYAADKPDDQLALYRDWADTYDDHLIDGLKYLAPDAVAAHGALPDLASDRQPESRSIQPVGAGDHEQRVTARARALCVGASEVARAAHSHPRRIAQGGTHGLACSPVGRALPYLAFAGES